MRSSVKDNTKLKKSKDWLFERMLKIDKLLVKLPKEGKTQVNTIRNEKAKSTRTPLKSRAS